MGLKERVKSTEYWMRQRVPSPFRRVLKALKMFKKPVLSGDIPQSLLEGCCLVSSRVDLIRQMPKDAVVAEMGTFKGDFARKIVKQCSPAELHLIDINYSKFDAAKLKTGSVTMHKGITWEIMGQFEDNYFDWVYIDADHSYSGVLKDAEMSGKKLKPGGFLIFNDFGHAGPSGSRYGVHRAAVEFSRKNHWKWKYLSYHPSALYDLAIQKPHG